MSFVDIVNRSGGLFDSIKSEKTVTTYLLKEFKNVDFFLKIQSDYEQVATRNLIATINEIEQVISAYAIDVEQIKQKQHLIFN